MTTITITLRDEDQSFIADAVKSGFYITKSEVVATALGLLKSREDLRQIRRAHLKREIQIGIDQLNRGEFAEFSATDIMRLGREKLATNNAK